MLYWTHHWDLTLHGLKLCLASVWVHAILFPLEAFEEKPNWLSNWEVPAQPYLSQTPEKGSVRSLHALVCFPLLHGQMSLIWCECMQAQLTHKHPRVILLRERGGSSQANSWWELRTVKVTGFSTFKHVLRLLLISCFWPIKKVK